MALSIGKPVAVAELIAKPTGRRLNERDLELGDLVRKVAEPENAEVAYPWDFAPEKPLTARAAAVRAIKRHGLSGVVFVSSKDGSLWFSQERLSARGRPKK
jgi:hypothetical protein